MMHGVTFIVVHEQLGLEAIFDMTTGFRDDFEREVARITGNDEAFETDYDGITDEVVADALAQFADAFDPKRSRMQVPKPGPNGTIEHESNAYNTGKNNLQALRLAHERGLDLLGSDAEQFNEFIDELVTDPDHRRSELVDYNDSISKPYAKQFQSAARNFYRFCTEPGKADERPDVNVDWPANEITIYRVQSDPMHDADDLLEEAEVDALREATIRSANPRRNRAFLELVAGTGQRRYALISLKVGDVHPDGDPPHIYLNPEIAGDGDKGSIETTDRWKPIVSDPDPVREWIQHHPLRDAEVRADHGAPDNFDDCFLFIGDPDHWNSDPSEHWDGDAARQMLERLKDRTANMPAVETVTKPVNFHNFRHWGYTKSKDLPIDESTRRKVFGWSPASDTGEKTYGHVRNRKAGENFAEAWADTFADDADTAGVAEQVVGDAMLGDLSPEAKRALVNELATDDELMAKLGEAVTAAME